MWSGNLGGALRAVGASSVRLVGKKTRSAPLVQELESRTMLSTHLTIIPTFASNITSDAKAPQIEAAINAAIKVFETDLSTPITVRILFEEGSGLGSSNTNFDTVSYSAYLSALKAHATSANDASAIATLPSGSKNPVNGGGSIDLTNPNARALGFSTSGGSDSTITLNTSICNLTRSSVNSNKYDLQSVAMHEIDEVLGTGSELDGYNNGDPTPTGAVEGDDLYRYAKAGVRSFSTSASAAAYYSIDGGKTLLGRFNQSQDGDFGDWFSENGGNVPQVQDAFATPGVIPYYNVELTRLDVLGYTPTFKVGTGIVKGYVFNDVNGNGVRNSGENFLSGWTIEAIQNGKVITTATSTALGYQITGLADGTYTIEEVAKSGYHQTTPASSYTVTITGHNVVITGKNFGDQA